MTNFSTPSKQRSALLLLSPTTKPSVAQRIPVPVSVQLYNVFPAVPALFATATTQNNENNNDNNNNNQLATGGDERNDSNDDARSSTTTTNNKWYRPQHTSKLLHEVRLDIVVREPIEGDDNNNNNKNERGYRSVTLYSEVDSSRSMRPGWKHLNEQLDVSNISIDCYESMTCQFSVVLTQQQPHHNDDDDSSTNNNDGSIGTANCSTSIPFLEIPVYPGKLFRIAKRHTDLLPANAVMIQYSDEQIRVPGPVYEAIQRLDEEMSGKKQQGVVRFGRSSSGRIIPKKAPPSKPPDDFSRFEDDVFRTLDQVSPACSANTSFMEQASIDEKEGSSCADLADAAVALFETSAFGVDTQFEEQCSDSIALLPRSGTQTQSASKKDLLRENEMLHRLIQEEEAALQREESQLQETTTHMQECLLKLQSKDDQTSQIVAATREEHVALQQTEFLLEAQRIRLMSELRTIYPVGNVPHENGGPQQLVRYQIRGLEIPAELYSGSVPEEALSAALGFLCHTINQMSKYLSVQLRYRLYYHSSRSAIQDERSAIFPLWQARGVVERDQLEHAVCLLDRCAECIAVAVDCRTVKHGDHVLHKVQQIYSHIIEGRER